MVLSACSQPVTLTCDNREAGLADVLLDEDHEPTPQSALAAFLDTHGAFNRFRLADENQAAEHVTWAFVDARGTTVATVEAERLDGSWAVVKWEYCRG